MDWDRVDRTLQQVLDAPPQERPARLDELCADDDNLRAEVASLLEAHEQAGDFLTTPVLGEGDEPGFSEISPGEFGPYRILRKLGEGGMSVVYLAERSDDRFDKLVAIKLIRPGAAGAEMVRRFRTEQRILASLEHPYIARLYDAGVRENGNPYFVMESIEGVPVDDYCEQAGLDVPNRLRLFVRICEAVSYAHRALIVHRDLKPENVLVTRDGRPKLLDFGTAKLLAPTPELGRADDTAGWLRLLTPNYASPEQVRGEPITTATDVYGLGVLLYKLLTGKVPRDFSGLGVEQIERQIRDRMPVKPSDAVLHGTHGQELAGQLRGDLELAGQELAGQLRGDLDNIVDKALRPEPERRYASVDRLSQDIERHLAGRPVSAHPDSLAYRLRKFVGRRRWQVAAASLFGVTVTLATVALAWQAGQMTQLRDRAEIERDKALASVNFLENIFETSKDRSEDDPPLTARELLQRAASRIEGSRGNAATRAAMLETLGRVQRRAGLFREAALALGEARSLYQTEADDDPRDHARVLAQLGALDRRTANFEQGRARLEQALESLTLHAGPGDASTLRTLNELAALLTDAGSHEEADARYRQLRAAKPTDAEAQFVHAEGSANYAVLLVATGELEAAEPILRETLSIWEQDRSVRLESLASLRNNLASLLYSKGHYREGIPFARQSVDDLRRALGAEHADVATAMGNLAGLLQAAEEYEEAETILRTAIQINERALGPKHPMTVNGRNSLAAVLRGLGRLEESEAEIRGVLRDWAEAIGSDHPWMVRALGHLAQTLAAQGRTAEAIATFHEALDLARQKLDVDHPWVRDLEAGLKDAQAR